MDEKAADDGGPRSSAAERAQNHTDNVLSNGADQERKQSSASEPDSDGDALEEALEQLGPFGLYQRYMVFMLCLPNILAAMHSLNYIFVADQVPFRCLVPECEAGYSQWDNESALALLPEDSRCQRYRPLELQNVTCLREQYHPNETVPCEQFVYQNLDTTFAEFNLACREWLRAMVGTIRNLALPLALILTGYTSDTYGRRTAFCIFSAFSGVLGIVKGFSINYQMYVSMEFLEAMLGYGFNSAAYVMMVELGRPSQRAMFACATGVAYGAGGVLFALVARAVPRWRRLLWAVHAPALLLPLYARLVPESPRWLAARGRTRAAAAVLRAAAAANKVTLNEETMNALENDTRRAEKTEQSSLWRQLIRSRILMFRLATCCWCWVAVAFVYYGLTINSVALSGDKYVNFALNMAMEIVASLLIMMALERFGRKWSIFTAFLLCGFTCVTPFFISHAGARLGLYFAGKLSITFAFNSLYVLTAELFPTGARSSALAACSLVGRLGSALAPLTPLLAARAQAALYGGCSLAAALAVLSAPETRRAALPHSARRAERL